MHKTQSSSRIAAGFTGLYKCQSQQAHKCSFERATGGKTGKSATHQNKKFTDNSEHGDLLVVCNNDRGQSQIQVPNEVIMLNDLMEVELQAHSVSSRPEASPV